MSTRFVGVAVRPRSRDWLRNNGHQARPVEYVFESGDRGRQFLSAVFERDGLPEPQYKPKLPPPGREAEVCTPLQAADVVAGSTRSTSDFSMMKARSSNYENRL